MDRGISHPSPQKEVILPIISDECHNVHVFPFREWNVRSLVLLKLLRQGNYLRPFKWTECGYLTWRLSVMTEKSVRLTFMTFQNPKGISKTVRSLSMCILKEKRNFSQRFWFGIPYYPPKNASGWKTRALVKLTGQPNETIWWIDFCHIKLNVFLN